MSNNETTRAERLGLLLDLLVDRMHEQIADPDKPLSASVAREIIGLCGRAGVDFAGRDGQARSAAAERLLRAVRDDYDAEQIQQVADGQDPVLASMANLVVDDTDATEVA